MSWFTAEMLCWFSTVAFAFLIMVAHPRHLVRLQVAAGASWVLGLFCFLMLATQ